MSSGLLPAVLVALLGGGLFTAIIAIRRAPVERATMHVDQASKVAGEALALLAAERERFLEELGHEHERSRQLAVANEALRDEVDAAHTEIARLEELAERKEPDT